MARYGPLGCMPVETLLLYYVVSLLAGLSCLAIYYELRRKRFEPAPSEDHIFRCEKCAFVYTDDPDVDRSRCPQCGTQNGVFKF
ncbi:MAG: hypothetical protein JWM99_2667 [Verrucomicrobiales bacterium]|nr:hypothetical protein [Verrucomicrobiales bacterium]